MNFSALKQELSDRGFADLSDTRLGQYINWARAELDEMFCWPYRETSVTGTAPLSISDLGEVEAVLNTTQNIRLYPCDYQSLLDMDADLSTSGTPSFYYIASPSGAPEVAVYPSSSTDTIGVQYWKVCPDLSSDTDTPLAPTRFHGLYVDMAVRRAYRNTDNHDAARAIQEDINDQIQKMVYALRPGIPDGPSAFTATSGQDY